nr:unnamed protein product [Digitaria exilis]
MTKHDAHHAQRIPTTYYTHTATSVWQRQQPVSYCRSDQMTTPPRASTGEIITVADVAIDRKRGRQSGDQVDTLSSLGRPRLWKWEVMNGPGQACRWLVQLAASLSAQRWVERVLRPPPPRPRNSPCVQLEHAWSQKARNFKAILAGFLALEHERAPWHGHVHRSTPTANYLHTTAIRSNRYLHTRVGGHMAASSTDTVNLPAPGEFTFPRKAGSF